MEQSGTPADAGGNEAQPAPVADATPSEQPQSENSDGSDDANSGTNSGDDDNQEARPAKRGWWQKSSKFLGLG